MFENPKQRAKLFLAFTLFAVGLITPLFSNRIFKVEERIEQEKLEKIRARRAEIYAIESKEDD